MKKLIQPISERELSRDYPIAGLVPGWFFCQREVSAGCYEVAGRDIYGREVSSKILDPEKALQECVAYARHISTKQAYVS